MLHFATFFDFNYLSRGLVLLKSLRHHYSKITFYVLCLDDSTVEYFDSIKSDFPQVVTIRIEEIEKYFPELGNLKNNRSKIEYYFTLSPYLPLYILEKYNPDHICTLDADIKFYSSPIPIFDYLKNYSIVITPHKFSKELKHLEIYGKNNVSLQIFKNDIIALSCLQLWKNQCSEWCKDYYDEENQRFADQKYLDKWDELYKDALVILNDDTTGLAVWNYNNYCIEKVKGNFLSNKKRIIFVHFHHFKILNQLLSINGFHTYKVVSSKGLKYLYKDYLQSLYENEIKGQTNNALRNSTFSKNNRQILLQEKSLFIKIRSFIFEVRNVDNLNKYFKKILWQLCLQ